jgi:hypothetical protein
VLNQAPGHEDVWGNGGIASALALGDVEHFYCKSSASGRTSCNEDQTATEWKGKYTPAEYTYFLNASFAILGASLALMFIYCSYKSIGAEITDIYISHCTNSLHVAESFSRN